MRSIQSQLRSLLTDLTKPGRELQNSGSAWDYQNPVTGSDGSTGINAWIRRSYEALTDNPEAVQAYFIGDGTKTGLAPK
jgi:flagellar hook-associated protein 2